MKYGTIFQIDGQCRKTGEIERTDNFRLANNQSFNLLGINFFFLKIINCKDKQVKE